MGNDWWVVTPWFTVQNGSRSTVQPGLYQVWSCFSHWLLPERTGGAFTTANPLSLDPRRSKNAEAAGHAAEKKNRHRHKWRDGWNKKGKKRVSSSSSSSSWLFFFLYRLPVVSCQSVIAPSTASSRSAPSGYGGGAVASVVAVAVLKSIEKKKRVAGNIIFFAVFFSHLSLHRAKKKRVFGQFSVSPWVCGPEAGDWGTKKRVHATTWFCWKKNRPPVVAFFFIPPKETRKKNGK